MTQTWRRVACAASPMCHHVACDPDNDAYAVSIRYIPAQGRQRRVAAMELSVMNRLHEYWCRKALSEADGT